MPESQETPGRWPMRWWRRFEGDPLPYAVMRVLWVRQAIRRVPLRARPRWLLNALFYAYEICFTCGRRVGPATGSWWRAPDALWREVMGEPEGIACPRCFTRAADRKGITIYWMPQEEFFDAH